MDEKLVGNSAAGEQEGAHEASDVQGTAGGTRRELLTGMAKLGGLLAATGVATAALGVRGARAEGAVAGGELEGEQLAENAPNMAQLNVSIAKLQSAGILRGDLGAGGHAFVVLAGKNDGKSASTHGPERRKADRPVCDCDDD